MKPILIAATALFVLSPMALAQEGHTTHNHDPPPAAATEADAADVKTCMAGHEGMEGCPANMEGKMADGHKMDHADMPMMGADGMAMDKDKMMDHGADGHKMDHADMPMMNHGKKPMMGADGMAMAQMATKCTMPLVIRKCRQRTARPSMKPWGMTRPSIAR